MATSTTTTTVSNQVRIQLSTRDASLVLPEQPGPILVDTKLRRYELSVLTNDLLEPTSPIPLDFLINGTILRTSLDAFLDKHALSAESLLSIEYIRAQLPPTTHASFEHDDWVGSVDVLSRSSPAEIWTGADTVRNGQERILSGGFDGIVRVWDMSGRVMAASKPETEEQRKRIQHIMAAKFISPTLIAAASGSRPQLWRYNESTDVTPAGTPQASLELVLDCYGNTSGINSLAIHGPSQRFLTAADDGNTCLWSSDVSKPSSLPPVPAHLVPTTSSSKRRKVTPSSTPTSGPLATLTGHTAPVTSTIFHPSDPTAAYTASRDATLRTWDLETAKAVSVRTPCAGHTRLTALCALPDLGGAGSGGLLAVSTCYNSIVLVDPREAGGRAEGRSAVMTLKGHRNEISCLAANPSNGYGLASGAYDGTVRVWDIRNAGGEEGVAGEGVGGKTARSSFRIPRRGDERCDDVVGGLGVKVFDVCWDREVGIVSGSEDKTVQVDR